MKNTAFRAELLASVAIGNSREPLNRIADATVRAIMDLELEALGDHCLCSQLRTIVMRSVEAAYVERGK